MKTFFFSFLYIIISSFSLLAQTPGETLPVWQVGMLDIHHISTGRGNSIFCILPDGTTLLIDAGDMSPLHARTLSERNCAMRPDQSKTAPQWIAAYIQSVYPQVGSRGIDYAMITHYHDDHFGEFDASRKSSGNGYLLFGITELGTLIPIHKLIDRGFDEPLDMQSEAFRNKYMADEYHMIQSLDEYRKYIAFQTAEGKMKHLKFKPGHKNQVALLKKPLDYPGFSIQNLFGGGNIWYGSGDSAFNALPANSYPGENPLSLGIKFTYGKFDYYTGADIAGMDGLGQPDNHSMEAQAAPVIGPVDVATLNHHGNRDSQSPVWVRTLRPRVWVQQTWSADHPGEEVLRRITSKILYPGDRDIYSTCMCEANKVVIGSAIDKLYQSTEGHVVVRVSPGGEKYMLIVTDDKVSGNIVKLVREYKVK